MVRRIPLKVGVGVVGIYVAYTGYAYERSQMEIQHRHEIYHQLVSQGLIDEKVRLVDPRFRSLKILGRYENPFIEYRPQTLFEFFVMRCVELTQHGKRGGLPTDPEMIKKILPSVVPDMKLISESRRGIDDKTHEQLPPLDRRLSYTWFGQSTGYLQIGKLSFLMDPLFSDCLVNRFIGPKRYQKSPVSLQTLLDRTGGAPEYVMVSHDHPDHLDRQSMATIGNGSKWIVPIGLGKYLKRHGIDNIIEMDWWDRVPLEINANDKHKYEVVCLPAMHWAGRNLLDSNRRLWCSFMILRDGKSIFYHGGDTGYTGELFRRIGEEFGPVKFCVLPIGQYSPPWHQRPRHSSPEESVQIMKDLHCHKMVGVHWGTFVLSSENFLEPAKKLAVIANKENRPNNIVIPQCGRTMVMDMDKLDFKHDDRAINDGDITLYK